MNRPPSILRRSAIVAIALLFFLPLWWVTVSALRPEDEIFRYLSEVSVWTLLPRDLTLDSLVALWRSDFARAIVNSVLVSVLTVFLGLAICSAAAFALAVIPFRGRDAVFTLMVISFLIPFDAIALPLFNILRGYDLQNTYLGLILPGIGNGLAVFLLRQFFLGIPKELREAALVDGMTLFGVYLRIYLPLSANALVSAGLILFIFQWQAYLWPLLIAPAPDYKVAAVAIAQFSTTFEVRYDLIFAAAFVISLIPMITMVVVQRFFSASIAATGGKE
jgi:ABC-type glycerol-3-phosphate transport system permease component